MHVYMHPPPPPYLNSTPALRGREGPTAASSVLPAPGNGLLLQCLGFKVWISAIFLKFLGLTLCRSSTFLKVEDLNLGLRRSADKDKVPEAAVGGWRAGLGGFRV